MKHDPAPPWRVRPRLSTGSRLVLAVAGRLRWPAERLGIDFEDFELVLANRLRLDSSATWGSSRGGLRIDSGLLVVALWIASSGLLAGLVALQTRDPRIWMVLGQSFWMFFLLLLALNHFASLLVEPGEIGGLAPLPLQERAVLAARIAQVAIWVLLLGACAALLPTALGLFVFPPLAVLLVYPLCTWLSGGLVVGSVTLLFALALRILGPARFQRVTFWIQVLGGVLLILVMQILPILPHLGRAVDVLDRHRWLGLLVPPLHYDGLFALATGHGTAVDVALSLAALLLPAALVALTFRLTSRHFLAALADPASLLPTRPRGFRPGPLGRLGDGISSRPGARAAYGFALSMTRRERIFLRTLLPQSAIFGVLILGPFLRSWRKGGEPDQALLVLGVYMLLLVSMLVFDVSRWSEHHEGAWWFQALPFVSREEILEGAAKALILGVVLPVVLVVVLGLGLLGGPAVLGQAAFAGLAVLALAPLQARFHLEEIPFTRRVVSGMQGTAFVRTFVTLLVVGVLAGFHVVTGMHWALRVAGIGLYVALLVHGWLGLRTLVGSRRRAFARATMPRA